MGRVVVLWGLFGGVDSGEVGHETETDDGSGWGGVWLGGLGEGRDGGG